MPGEFTHKGVTITITESGSFRYINRVGHSVTKPSLKAAQTAIDKEHPANVVPALTQYGKRVEIAGVHRSRGYLTPSGETVDRYGNRLYTWSDEAVGALDALRERERVEDERHRDATYALTVERERILKGLGTFNFDVEQAKVRAAQKEQPAG